MLFHCKIVFFLLRKNRFDCYSSGCQSLVFLLINTVYECAVALAPEFFILTRLEYGKKIHFYHFYFHFALRSCPIIFPSAQ